jgi:hypothetical protein
VKPCPKCKKMFRNDGLPIHLARAHNIHPQHEDVSHVCPIPWCGMVVPDLLRHFEEQHEDWRLSSGKFVFEVGK